MSGICSAHQGHDPECRLCNALPPKPTFTVEITVGGCDWGTVMSRFVEAANHVQAHGPQCTSVWGGAGTHGHVHIERRDVTAETYEAELSAWWLAKKATATIPTEAPTDA